jgi:UDP-glucose 4-epimerase
MMQFIHQEDLIESHFKVALLDEAPGGIYNIAGRGALPLSYITRLMGKINIPLIYSFAYLLFYILRAGRIAPFPPQHIDYIRFTFVADGTKVKEQLGFIPKYSTKEVVEEFAGYVKLKKARIKQD